MYNFLIPLVIPASIVKPASRDSFELDGTTISRFIGKETEVVIPEGVRRIGKNAFQNCGSVTSVVIPEGVEKIPSRTFVNCRSLELVVIPESVKKFGKWAFTGCPNLTICAPEGSKAEEYARQNGIPFQVK